MHGREDVGRRQVKGGFKIGRMCTAALSQGGKRQSGPSTHHEYPQKQKSPGPTTTLLATKKLWLKDPWTWQVWAYTDGSRQTYGCHQNIGAGVFKPCKG